MSNQSISHFEAPPIRILHLSDLHVAPSADPVSLLQPLLADLRDPDGGLGFAQLDYVVVSGDLTNRAQPEELVAARTLLEGIASAFAVPHDRFIVVPGNHDLSWDEEVYRYKTRRQVDPQKLKEGSYKEQADGYLIRDDAAYPARFRNFSQHLYRPFFGIDYPLSPEEQAITSLGPGGIQFLALNSAWQIDEHFVQRAAIHEGALSRGLVRADEELEKAKGQGRIAAGAQVLRIAVWHHPVAGNKKMEKDTFLQRLQTAGFQLCLHGHVHEDRTDVVGYLHPRRIHVAGAGSFGSPSKNRPESTPRLYNVLEVARDSSRVRVHTRCLRKDGGAWEGWAVWPGATPSERRTFYEIPLATTPVATVPIKTNPSISVSASPPPTGNAKSPAGAGAVSGAGARFDLFLCYNRADLDAARALYEQLRQRGVRPFFDVKHLQPGLPWQDGIQDQIRRIGAAAVLIGGSGLGPWQQMEQRAFLQQFVARRCPVIPVLLPAAKSTPELPAFLAEMQWIDLRADPADGLERLAASALGQLPSD